jgi:hypothetical protein
MKPIIIRRGGKWQIRPIPKCDFMISEFVNYMLAVNFCIKLNNREAV